MTDVALGAQTAGREEIRDPRLSCSLTGDDTESSEHVTHARRDSSSARGANESDLLVFQGLWASLQTLLPESTPWAGAERGATSSGGYL